MKNLRSMRAVAEWFDTGGANGVQLPFIKGTWFFVDPTSGSNNRVGTSPELAFADVATAYAACTSGRGDGICIISRGITTAGTTSYLTSAITWSKWGITVVGIAAPTRFTQWARISNASTALALSNLITVSGSNNAFYNIHLYNGGTTGVGCLAVTGNRNFFGNCHLIGADGVTAAGTTDNDLTLTGASENTFVGCVIGSDTKDRGNNASAGIHFGSGCQRNVFEDCYIVRYQSTGTGGAAIKFDGAGDAITRTQYFKDCIFECYDEANAAANTSLVIGTAPTNGVLLFKDCMMNGYADWCAVAAARVLTNMPAAVDTGGKALAQNPS